MKVIIEKDYDSLSKRAAEILIEEINKDPEIVLGLATGSTPIGTYKELIKAYKNGELDFSKVKTFNLDDYIGLDGSHPNSYRYFMDEELLNHINIDIKNTHVPDGKTEDPEAYCKEYDRYIDANGGIDVQILGIGSNGHIGFNEPAEELTVGTTVANLSESTIRDNARFFDSIDDVPRTAITMGMGSILKAKKIILLASGKNKKAIMKRLLENDKITTQVPASLLLLHPNVVVIVDEEAYKG